MVDLNPEIWNNPTLGDAATSGFADEEALQRVEDRAAKAEGREPWIARRISRDPNSPDTIVSSYDDGMRLIDPATLDGIPTEYNGIEPGSDIAVDIATFENTPAVDPNAATTPPVASLE